MAASVKQFIIETAAPLFNKKGYAATTVTDILLATGLARVSFYNHFRGKDEIARAALAYNHRAVMGALEARLNCAATFRGQLEQLLDFYKNYDLYPVIEGGCPILNAISTEAVTGLAAIALEGLNHLLQRVQQIIRSGKEAGEFRPELDEAGEAISIVAAIKGGMLIRHLSGEPEQLNTVLTQLRLQFDNLYNYPGNEYQRIGHWQLGQLLPIHLS